MHKVLGHVANRAVEGLGRGVFLGEPAAPLGLVVDRGHQGQNGVGGQLQVLDLVGQQTAGLIVDPALQRLGHGRGIQISPEAGGVVVLRQGVQRILIERHAVLQPEGPGQNAGGGAVVGVVVVPEIIGLGSQGLDGVAAQQGENLVPALAAGELGQHGQSHIDVQRGIGPVFRTGSAEEGGDAGAEVALQAVGIGRVPVLGALVRPPGVVLGFKVGVHFIGIGGHFRVAGFGDGVGGGGGRPAGEENAHGNGRGQDRRGGRGPPGPRGPALFVAAQQHVVVHLADAFIEILFIHGEIPPYIGVPGASAGSGTESPRRDFR